VKPKQRGWLTVQLPMLGAVMTGHPTCGPCEQEAGQSILLAIPVMIAVGFALQWLYRRCWNKIRPLTIFNFKSSAWILAVAISLALIGLLARHEGRRADDYLLMAVPIVGASYLALRLGVQIKGWPWWNRYCGSWHSQRA
jgi:hypothetical protein